MVLNTVPPEVIKAANKNCQAGQRQRRNIKSPASNENILFLVCKAMLLLQIPAWGLGSPCGYDATSLLTIAILDWCVLK